MRTRRGGSRSDGLLKKTVGARAGRGLRCSTSWLHALLRQDQRRTLSPLPEDPKEANDQQAEEAAPRDEATDAPTAPRPAQVAGCGAARALRPLRHPWQ